MMDIGIKLIEIENRYYLQLANELRSIGISPSVGMIVVQGICAKFENDALAICTSSNVALETELSNKMKEIEELKQAEVKKNQDESNK